MDEYWIAPRKEVKDFIDTQKFDSVALVYYDSHTSMLMNWWHFSGHPSSWGPKELAERTSEMLAAAVEGLKTDINVPSSREVVIKHPKISALTEVDKSIGDNDWLYLTGFAVMLGRHWIHSTAYLCKTAFCFGIFWNKSPTYKWRFSCDIGPLVLSIGEKNG